MAISATEGEFGLDCWVDAESEAEADQELFSDDADELRAEAERLIGEGKFRYISLSRWDDAADAWVELEAFEA